MSNLNAIKFVEVREENKDRLMKWTKGYIANGDIHIPEHGFLLRAQVGDFIVKFPNGRFKVFQNWAPLMNVK